MALLTDSQLHALQHLAESGMNQSCTILIRSVVETNDGQESVWATGDTVIGWVYESTPTGATLGEIAGAVGVSEIFSIRFPVGTEVHSGDHVAIGTSIYTVQHTSEDDSYKPWLVLAARLVE